MSSDVMWDGFATAVVQLELATGAMLLEPAEVGDVGVFPFAAPLHIITAYNPAGIEIDEHTNAEFDRRLRAAVSTFQVVRSVGSARDGSWAEPGFGIAGISLDQALELARDFGQRAIYQWAADALTIVGVDEPVLRRLGWSLSQRQAQV